jgi:nucleotide-binding universal stress UspA family protein
MYDKVMVPLDGSNAAEVVLPYAEEIAVRFNSDLVFVSVGGTALTQRENLFRSYLRAIEERVRSELKDWRGKPETAVGTEVLMGKPAESLLRYVKENNVSLVVMASRGMSESPWTLGSVTEKVLHATRKPVLVIRKEAPAEGLRRKSLIRKILAPLDGSNMAEEIFPDVVELGKVTKAEIVLFRAYGPLFRIASDQDLRRFRSEEEIKELTRFTEEEAESYLKRIAGPLHEKGLNVSYALGFGDPAEAILDHADSNAVDLIVISAHGLSGFKRWAIGSVTDKVLHASNTPVLVVKCTAKVHERVVWY